MIETVCPHCLKRHPHYEVGDRVLVRATITREEGPATVVDTSGLATGSSLLVLRDGWTSEHYVSVARIEPLIEKEPEASWLCLVSHLRYDGTGYLAVRVFVGDQFVPYLHTPAATELIRLFGDDEGQYVRDYPEGVYRLQDGKLTLFEKKPS